MLPAQVNLFLCFGSWVVMAWGVHAARLRSTTSLGKSWRSAWDEGFLHKAEIHDDIRTLKVSKETEAEGCGGGFPCQARFSCKAHLFKKFDVHWLYCQGISCGGSQGGLDWSTQQLASKGFCNLWQDAGPQKVGLQSFDNFLWTSTLLARKLIYLENVKSILSKATAMQTVMKFLIKAGQPGQQFANLIPGILPNTFVWQKACADRGLELSWSCAALENVGLPVPSSKNQMFSGGFSYCKAVFLNFGFMISFFPKAQRRRVFFFAVAQNFKLFQDQTKYLWIMAWLENVKLLPTLWHQFWIIVKMFLDGRIAPCSPWALSSRRSSMIWILCQCRSGLTNLKPNSEETARMHMLGNIVVPCQAELACCVLHPMSVDR